MRFLLTLSMAAMLAFLPGCGEKPADEQGADSTAVAGDQGVPRIDLQTPELAVGQWICYGVNQDSTEVKLSVVSTQEMAGVECFWVQVESQGESVQILIDPARIRDVMTRTSETANEFYADPAAYVAANVPSDPRQMLTTEENIQNFMALVGAIKMVKVMDNGTLMAYDLTNVPATIEPVLSDSAFLAQLQAGMQVDVGAEGATDSLIEKISQYEFTAENTDMDIAGTGMGGSLFTMTGPEMTAEVFLCADLPIIPLGYAKATRATDGDEQVLSVRGFGMDGAVDLMPGAPAQTVDVAPMVQMLIMQMQSQMQQPQGAQGNR